eukprot:2430762-Rhodomonas_salina.2
MRVMCENVSAIVDIETAWLGAVCGAADAAQRGPYQGYLPPLDLQMPCIVLQIHFAMTSLSRPAPGCFQLMPATALRRCGILLRLAGADRC